MRNNCYKSNIRKKYGWGDLITQTGSGALTGGEIGGPWGAAIGGAVGLGGALLSGALDDHEAEQKSAQYNKILHDSQGVLANYPTNGLPQAKYGSRIDTINFGYFTNPNYYRGLKRGMRTIGSGGRFINSPPLYDQRYDNGGLLPQPTDGSGAEQLASDMALYKGATHEQGGIDLDTNHDNQPNIEVENNEVIKDDMVLSDRLYPTDGMKNHLRKLGLKISDKDTYASLAERAGKKKGNWESKIGSNLIGEHTAAEKMVQKYDEAVNMLFSEQQSQKQNMKSRVGSYKKATGGYTEDGPGYPKKDLYNESDPKFKKRADHDAYYVQKATKMMQEQFPDKYDAFQTAHNTLDAGKDVGAGLGILMTEYNFPQYQDAKDYKLSLYKSMTSNGKPTPVAPNRVNMMSKRKYGGYFAGGGKFGEFADDNYGNIASGIGFIGNQIFASQLKTDFQPDLAPTPQNTYTDRTNYIKNRGEQQFRTATQGLNYGSGQDNMGFKSNLYAKTLENTNEGIDREQLRKDAYTQNYNQMLAYNNFFNTQQSNQAKQMSFDNRNQKVAMQQSNFDNLIRSGIGNREAKDAQDLDFTKSLMYSTMQGNTGVADRLNDMLPDRIRRKYFGDYGRKKTANGASSNSNDNYLPDQF